jgi:hypothetical protein
MVSNYSFFGLMMKGFAAAITGLIDWPKGYDL